MFAAQEEYDELLRYAVVVPSYPTLPSLTMTGVPSSGPSTAVSQPVQTMPTHTQPRVTGGVHVVATTEAGSTAAQTAGADVITVCPPVKPTTYIESSLSSQSPVHGQLVNFTVEKINFLLIVLTQCWNLYVVEVMDITVHAVA